MVLQLKLVFGRAKEMEISTALWDSVAHKGFPFLCISETVLEYHLSGNPAKNLEKLWKCWEMVFKRKNSLGQLTSIDLVSAKGKTKVN